MPRRRGDDVAGRPYRAALTLNLNGPPGTAKSALSLAAVCKRELDKVLDKTRQVSTWTRRPLSAEQLAYAALDVEVLVPLYQLFSGLQPELALPT